MATAPKSASSASDAKESVASAAREATSEARAEAASAAREKSTSELEADIRQLQDDLARLTEQLAATGQHTYDAAKRAAVEGVEQLRTQGEAAMEGLRENARELEDQVVSNVREKPIASLAIAAGVGFLIAVITGR